jgi:tRNA nucleotidyltransferase/poly(A) polymerase
MPPTPDSKNSAALESTATRLVERLRAAGHEALFAGGCVRDRLLGKEAHDIDIATSARPEEIQNSSRAPSPSARNSA